MLMDTFIVVYNIMLTDTNSECLWHFNVFGYFVYAWTHILNVYGILFVDTDSKRIGHYFKATFQMLMKLCKWTQILKAYEIMLTDTDTERLWKYVNRHRFWTLMKLC